MRIVLRRSALIAVCVIAGSCADQVPQGPPTLTGTWRRGNDRIRSLIAFVPYGDSLAFRWVRNAADGRRRTECTWDGACEERILGRKVGEYRCAVLPGAEAARASVRCEGWLDEGERQDVSWTDDFVVEPDGITLKCYTREANGQTLEGDARQLRTFTKVSPSVANPPRRLIS
jgi:hypothetical protein